jgi:transcriptional regulator of arginine metabolism
MKSKRQAKILELISQQDIETQEELAAKLAEAGLHVTQATISRDIRELKLSKVNSHAGRQKYAAMVVSDGGISDKLSRVLKEGFVSCTDASHLIVVRTMPGMAMAVAAAIDSMDLPGLAGCVPGDDTIICALRSDEDAAALMSRIDRIVRN